VRSSLNPGEEAKRVTIREQLRRANPTVNSPTYRLLTGKINEKEYRRILREERHEIDGSTQKKHAAADR
jgi:hypothetical protein